MRSAVAIATPFICTNASHRTHAPLVGIHSGNPIAKSRRANDRGAHERGKGIKSFADQ